MRMKPLSSLVYAMILLDMSISLKMVCEQITNYTVRGDGRIVVTPPLQALSKSGGGVRTIIYNSLFPSYVCEQICSIS